MPQRSGPELALPVGLQASRGWHHVSRRYVARRTLLCRRRFYGRAANGSTTTRRGAQRFEAFSYLFLFSRLPSRRCPGKAYRSPILRDQLVVVFGLQGGKSLAIDVRVTQWQLSSLTAAVRCNDLS